MGALPSQQPPDWWNISGPWMSRSRRTSSAAAGVSSTRGVGSTAAALEEAELLRGVADQQVLGLLVVVQHHLVVLAADTGLLVAAERRVGGVGVVAVRPDAARLDGAARAVGGVDVPRPHAGPEPVQRVVGDLDGVVEVVEGRDRDDRAEDLLLEDPHPVVALEDRRLDVVTALQLPVVVDAFAAGENLGALLPADVEIGEDLPHLVVGGLAADHRAGVGRGPRFDEFGPADRRPRNSR